MALLPRFEAVGYLDYAATLFEMSMIFVLFSILSLNSSFSKFKKKTLDFFFLKFTQKISCSYLNHVFLSFIFQSQYMRTFPKNRDHPRRHRGNHDKWIFKLVVNSHRIQSNLRPVSVWRGMHHKKKVKEKRAVRSKEEEKHSRNPGSRTYKQSVIHGRKGELIKRMWRRRDETSNIHNNNNKKQHKWR